MAGSEYGGMPGMIQPGLEGVDPEAAAVGLRHDSTQEGAADRHGVRDAAMIVRRAGMKEARGVPATAVFDVESNRMIFTQYDEELARDDLINGRNT